MKQGRLYLIPTLLGDGPADDTIPANFKNIMSRIRHYIVEDLRTARRFIRKIDTDSIIDDMHFELLNEHTDKTDIAALLAPILDGHDAGLMSEAGTPCVADPGSELVALAHARGIKVIPLSGPSSITLALMASGFNGQSFSFHGYLPIDKGKRIAAIKRLEQNAAKNDQTQIFIETPYRNMQMLESLLSTCQPGTRLCVAANLTSKNEMIVTRTIADWKNKLPAIHKQPAVFLIYKAY